VVGPTASGVPQPGVLTHEVAVEFPNGLDVSVGPRHPGLQGGDRGLKLGNASPQLVDLVLGRDEPPLLGDLFALEFGDALHCPLQAMFRLTGPFLPEVPLDREGSVKVSAVGLGDGLFGGIDLCLEDGVAEGELLTDARSAGQLRDRDRLPGLNPALSVSRRSEGA